MKLHTLIKYIFVVLFLATTALVAQEKPVELVNPFIGSDNFGTTNPGAVRANGMMSVAPFNVMGSETNKYVDAYHRRVECRL